MFVSPVWRKKPMAVVRTVARIAGIAPVRT